jgi:hypothetical protein
LGKGSASVRVGGKGAGYTVGTSGQRATVGVPGTGISYSQKVSGNPPANGGGGVAHAIFGFIGGVLLGLVAILFEILSGALSGRSRRRR